MKKIIYLVFSVIMALVGYFLILSPRISDSVAFNFGQPLFYGFLPIVIYFIILLFFDWNRVKSQYKLFNYYLISSIILVFLTSVDCRAPLGLCIDKERISVILAILFIIISIIYSTIQFVKNKKHP